MKIIREAIKEDVKDVFALINELENTSFHFDAFKTIYESILDHDMYHTYVYCLDEAIVGFINCRIETQLHHNGMVCEILELVVKEEYREKKVGDAIFSYAEDIAKEHGCMEINLVTSNHRSRAQHFYEDHQMIQTHLGFTKKFI